MPIDSLYNTKSNTVYATDIGIFRMARFFYTDQPLILYVLGFKICCFTILGFSFASVSYGMLVWGSCGQVLFSNYESIHVRAAKIMFDLDWRMPSKEVLATAKWNTFDRDYVSETIINFSASGLLSSFTVSYELSFCKV